MRPIRYLRSGPAFSSNPELDELARQALVAPWALMITASSPKGVDLKPLARELLQRGLEIAELRALLAAKRRSRPSRARASAGCPVTS